MAVDSYILDGNGRGTKGSVTSIGEIVVGVFSHDLTMFVKLEVDDTAYNFYVPRDGEQFVITGMRIKASRSVSNTVDAEIIIYEAEGPTDLTVIKILHEEAMIRGESATLNPMNILVAQGVFVNAKTTDPTVYITIMGYYIPVV